MTRSKELMMVRNKEIDEAFILAQCEALLKEAGITKPPIDPHVLGSFRDIRKVEEQNMPEAGMLIPVTTGGLQVYLRATDSEERKNFTHFHEISHTFFPDFTLKPQKRVDVQTGEYNKKNTTEYLCDYGASNLLMPDFLFKPEFEKRGFSIGTLEELHSLFNASLEATGLKMTSQSTTTGFVVWEKKLKPVEARNAKQSALFSQYKPQEKLRVKFGVGLEGIGHIPPNKSLSEDGGIIEAAFVSGIQKNGTETIDFGNFRVKLEVQAMPVGGTNPRVLTLIKAI